LIDHYDWPGGREAMLRFGPDTGPVVVAALPLFEEANRTRSFVVTILRMLAARGIAGALPDLPGQGESLVPLERTSMPQMQDALAFACDRFDREGRACYALGIRSGTLIHALAPVYGRWQLAPQSGSELLRELKRMAMASGAPDHGSWWSFEDVTEIAGNRLGFEMLSELASAVPYENKRGIPLRTVRYESDPRPADLKLPGAPLWRRAEPGNDPALAARLADDIAAWVRACAS
jgi:hypothetical protein